MSNKVSAVSQQQGSLSRGVLGTRDIVFMVLAAAAPMAVVVGLMPLAFAFGNGAGIPGTYLGAIVALLLFAVGYVRIIPHIKNAGAFYAYIAAGFGRPTGLAAAYIAAICYFALSASTLSVLAFFLEQFFAHLTGMHTRWDFWAYGSIGVVSVLAYHRITLAAKILGIALAAEVALILVLDLAIVRDVGLGAFSLRAFSPSTILTPGLGIGAIYAFDSLIGIEGTAIYQEEARNPDVTVPKATYISIGVVGLFYVFTAWCLSSAVGLDSVAAVSKANPGTFIIDQATKHMGQWGADGIALLVLTSSLAAVLGLFNNSARYLYALARDGVIPATLSKTHVRYQSPHIAASVLAVGLVLVVAVSHFAGLDPFVNVTTALVGFGSVGLMALMATTALAVPTFFAYRGTFSFATTVAPTIGGLMIASATVLAFLNYPLLTGVDSTLVNHLPYLLLAIAAVGVAQALRLRARQPELYRRIGTTRLEHEIEEGN